MQRLNEGPGKRLRLWHLEIGLNLTTEIQEEELARRSESVGFGTGSVWEPSQWH